MKERARNYLLFAGWDYHYPLGGARDFKGAYPTLLAAKDGFATLPDLLDLEWAHVAHFDGSSLKVLCRNDGKGWKEGEDY